LDESPVINIASDQLAAGHRATELFVQAVRNAFKERGCCRFAVSGGKSPRTFFETLGCDSEAVSLDWKKIHLFWVDERCVGPESVESNYRLAKETFIRKVGIPAGNVHRIKGEDTDHDAESRRYETELRKVFGLTQSTDMPRFDLMVMGVGADGHTASLFQGSAVLDERNRLVRAVEAAGSRLARITITPPVILAAREIIVIVCGKDKAEVLSKILCRTADSVKYPASLLLQAGRRVKWLVDKEAASLLPQAGL